MRSRAAAGEWIVAIAAVKQSGTADGTDSPSSLIGGDGLFWFKPETSKNSLSPILSDSGKKHTSVMEEQHGT